MTIRPILIHPDPRLKKVCKPVENITGELHALSRDMLETMYDAPGIGLAAPQVGILKRLIVLDAQRDKNAPRSPVVMFNPEVIAKSEDLNTYEEGCLSIPEQYAEVTRPAEVRVRGLVDGVRTAKDGHAQFRVAGVYVPDRAILEITL